MSSSTVSTTTSTDVVKTAELAQNLTLNEKGAVAFANTTDARLDFFFHAVRKLPKADTQSKFEAAYKEQALDALKLAFQLRDCRGGKGERELFRQCIDWLARNHAKQLLANIEIIPEFGRFEDLLWLMNEQDYSADIVRAAVSIFAKQLKKDQELMNEGKPVSLCAKWAPTEKASHDRKLHVVNQICRELGVNKKDYRKKFVSPLREYLRVVERYMCLGQWDKIDYSKVPSLAMNKLKKAFEKKDPERFKAWKAALERGDEGVKVNASVIEPHELVRQYMNTSKEKDTVTEEQWKEVLARVSTLGTMNKTLVLSDVSGSMSGTPMEVSIALGLLISTLTAKPFQGLVITFHENPTFFNVQGNTLREQVHSLMNAPWGGSTQLGKAFDLILDLAKKNNVKAEDMPERLIIISDMQFDVIEGHGHKPSLDGIRAKYDQAGYKCPQLVFWNCRAVASSAPATADDKNVALLSGYSPSIMKALLEGDMEQFTPYGIMRKTIDDKRYGVVKLADE